MNVFEVTDNYFFQCTYVYSNPLAKYIVFTHYDLHGYNAMNKENPILPFIDMTKSRDASLVIMYEAHDIYTQLTS